LARSKEFYEAVVGPRLSGDTIQNHLVFDCGDATTLLVYGRSAPSLADHTQVRFWTDDVEGDVEELAKRGVVFDELDLGAIKTVNAVATVPGIGRSAWFKDPDGNTLALFEPERAD
jgi:predicted enzyme related to lactoylglutathione lyase